MNVHILGDKTVFLSKNAITRLKNDVKANVNGTFDEKKYLQDGFSLTIKIEEHDTFVSVISKTQLVELEKEKKKQELKQKLRESLHGSRKVRSGDMKKKLESLKRSVPTKVFDSYSNLLTRYKLENLPAPDEVINNVEKYKLQISAVMGKIGKVSDDPRVSNAIRHYFTTLGEFLGIEPMSMEVIEQMKSQLSGTTQPVKENENDTDDEDD